jgi:hypothetical protein
MLALAVLLPAALRVAPLRAQHDTMLMGTTPGTSLPLGVASARPGSGTSWLPDSSRIPMFHASIAGWSVMVHGALFAQYDTQTTVHGGRQFGLVDWEMATALRAVGPGVIGATLGTSLESLVDGPHGYPELLQSGGCPSNMTKHLFEDSPWRPTRRPSVNRRSGPWRSRTAPPRPTTRSRPWPTTGRTRHTTKPAC